MFQKIKFVGGIIIAGFIAMAVLTDSSSEQTADLGQVLDRTEFTLVQFEGHLGSQNISDISEAEMDEFVSYYSSILNSEPRFYDKALGLEIMEDATFLGFADDNSNGVQDDGEGKVFTVEIDEENNRLIATDMAGNSSGLRFSGSGFIAGALIGNLINRQRAAGVTRSSFNSRNVTPRSSYRAPTSSRSGGPRSGK